MFHWRCPGCGERTESEIGEGHEPQVCSGCHRSLRLAELLCVVCDAVSSIRRRDSVHYWCISCGHTQTLWVRSA